jgi:hypothetical protein
MTTDIDADDPVYRAIDEFRRNMDQLFDEEILRMCARGHELGAGGGPLAVFDPGSTERPWSAIIPWHGLKPRSTGRQAADRSAPANARRPAGKPATPEPGKANGPEREEDDPRQRLDALARHLDDRLRRARDSVGGERPKTNPET